MQYGFYALARLLAIAAVAMAMALNAGATPGCDPATLSVRADRIANYLPFSEHAETINIRVEGSADSACRVALRISSGYGRGLQKNAERLEVVIRTRQGQILDGTGSEQISLTLLPKAGSRVSAELIADIPARQDRKSVV